MNGGAQAPERNMAMSRMQWLAASGVAVVLMAGAVASAADGARVAVVNLEQLLKAHPDTPPAEASLEKMRQEYESERRDMLEERKKLKDAFESARDELENPAISDEARAAKAKVAQERFQALREFERKIGDVSADRQKELNEQGKRLREQIVGKIRVVINQYAKDNKIDIVLNGEDAGLSAFGSVLYREPKLDVTDPVKALIQKAK